MPRCSSFSEGGASVPSDEDALIMPASWVRVPPLLSTSQSLNRGWLDSFRGGAPPRTAAKAAPYPRGRESPVEPDRGRPGARHRDAERRCGESRDGRIWAAGHHASLRRLPRELARARLIPRRGGRVAVRRIGRRDTEERHGIPARSPRSWELLDRATRVGGDQPKWDDERRLDIVRRRRSRTIR